MPKAIRIRRYGDPDVMVYETVEVEPPAPGDVRIRMTAAGINHTDLEIRAGVWPIAKAAPFPYTPGVEVVGVLTEVGVAVSDWSPGQAVVTMMQGLGGVLARRAGGYADYVTVGADAIAALPDGLTPLEMATIGLGGVTAYEGLGRIGAVAGKRILITGAAGGVGSSGVSIAKAQGATVIAMVSRDAHGDYARSLGADEVIVAARGTAPQIPPESIDGVLDSVAGVVFSAAVRALRPGGVLSLVGAMAGGDVAFDAWTLIRPLTLTGYSSEDLDGVALDRVVKALAVLKGDGMVLPESQTAPLAEAAAAHRLLETGGVKGRVILVPG
ncbi:quinone oxidoreductase family protein [Phenylobacterium immobile]|uniref:quinone oxidoreductase family protein n=1 Tax=Phenylobacterium immobile TaxID=21 RepID=UPI000AC52836|nr:NADP-dependent oxidoreductase [Phenylobacterium immobile]